MRDILVTLIVFGSLYFIIRKPWVGAVMWVWISVMNPHSQGWGFARSFPFAQIIALVTVAAFMLDKEKRRLPMTAVSVLFIMFMAWMCVTSVFAIHDDQISGQLIKVAKIVGMTLVVLLLLQAREHVQAIIWTIVVSVGYYGVKGGVFTIRTGGTERVWGPAGTFIEGNNEVALAFVMVIPLMYYLYLNLHKSWHRYAMLAAMLLCALASLGSYSRGAFLAIAAMVGFLWLKSRQKVRLGLLIAISAPILLAAMPSKYFDRMDTINSYEEDASAMGRINAWRMAFNLANDRVTGGGFEIYDSYVFSLYAPIPQDVHAAHSIYFQVLGEHGWFGLLIYLALMFATWRTGSAIVRIAGNRPELKWAVDMATMCQVSLIGFWVGGAFLSLAYFDVPYYVMVVLVAVKVIVEKEVNPAGNALTIPRRERLRTRKALTQRDGSDAPRSLDA